MSSPDKTRAERSLREKARAKPMIAAGFMGVLAPAAHAARLCRDCSLRCALIFSYVEMLVPIPVPIPGVKLGLANLVILIALYRLGFRYAFTINCVRIVIAGLLFSGVFGMLYSFGGGILSILVMYLLYRTKLFSMVGISMAGGVMHNLGQLLTACAIMSNLSLMSYFAVLFFSGLISGILIGILAYSHRETPARGLPSKCKGANYFNNRL